MVGACFVQVHSDSGGEGSFIFGFFSVISALIKKSCNPISFTWFLINENEVVFMFLFFNVWK